MTAQLPKDRITTTPPFTVCGVDFTGPVYISSEKGAQKSYIALFTCAVTRAVHIELVSDMSTNKFLLAFRRFLSRRGTCSTIYSDNAKTFKSTDTELRKFCDILKNSSVKDFFASEGISWKFIAEKAPWWGGFYERLMKSIKDPLRKILGKALLNFEEILTILTEIENVLNHRPLTCVYENGEPVPLTPSHFLQFGRDNVNLPSHYIDVFAKIPAKEHLTRRHKYQSKLLGQLWLKWKEQYLLNLRTAHHRTSPNPQENL